MIELPPSIKTVVISLHPAFAMHGVPQAMPEIEEAIRRARLAAEGMLDRPTFKFNLDPTPQEVAEYITGLSPSHPIAFDVETPLGPGQSISLCGISGRWGEALVFPWTPEHADAVAVALADPTREKVAHNKPFDFRRFLRAGCRIVRPTWDTMAAEALIYPPSKEMKRRKWFALSRCVLRRFPLPFWKDWNSIAGHLLADLWFPEVPRWQHERLYCALDVATTWMLQRRQEEELDRAGMLRLYREIVAPAGLTLTMMEDGGMPLDIAATGFLRIETAETRRIAQENVEVLAREAHTHRLGKLKETIRGYEKAIEARANEYPADPTGAGGEVRCQEHVDYRGTARRRKCPRCTEVYQAAAPIRAGIASLRKDRSRATQRLRQVGPAFDAGNDNHWRFLLFSPKIEGGLGLRATRLTGKTAQPGVDDDDIQELQRIYPNVALLKHRSEIQHLLHRLRWLDSLKPDDGGRVHFSYPLHRTNNGRVAAGKGSDEEGKPGEKGNIQNVPEDDRRIFRAEPGFMLVEEDYSQIELRVMAWLAKDLKLLGALRDGVDVHALNAAAIFGIDPRDAATHKVFVEGMWQSARRASKRPTHGWDYGLGDAKAGKMLRQAEPLPLDEVLRWLNMLWAHSGGHYGVSTESWQRRKRAAERSAFPEAEHSKLIRRIYDEANTLKAREMRLAYFKQWPGLAQFQERVVAFVTKNRVLTNAFGRRLRFYGFRWDYQKKVVIFDEREEALAILPAGTTGDIAKAVLWPRRQGALAVGGELLTMTHDSFLGHVPESKVEEYAATGKKILEREWKELGAIEGFGYFKCPVTTKAGRNWAPASEANPDGLKTLAA